MPARDPSNLPDHELMLSIDSHAHGAMVVTWWQCNLERGVNGRDCAPSHPDYDCPAGSSDDCPDDGWWEKDGQHMHQNLSACLFESQVLPQRVGEAMTIAIPMGATPDGDFRPLFAT